MATRHDGLRSLRWDAVMTAVEHCPRSEQAEGQLVAVVSPRPDDPLAIVAATACNVGAGDPPSGLWVIDSARSPTHVHVVQALFGVGRSGEPTPHLSDGGRIITATIFPDTYGVVARPPCCHFDATWRWNGHRYVGSPAAYLGPSPLVVSAHVSADPTDPGIRTDVTVTIRDTGTLPLRQVAVAYYNANRLTSTGGTVHLPDLGPGQSTTWTWTAPHPEGCAVDAHLSGYARLPGYGHWQLVTLADLGPVLPPPCR